MVEKNDFMRLFLVKLDYFLRGKPLYRLYAFNWRGAEAHKTLISVALFQAFQGLLDVVCDAGGIVCRAIAANNLSFAIH